MTGGPKFGTVAAFDLLSWVEAEVATVAPEPMGAEIFGVGKVAEDDTMLVPPLYVAVVDVAVSVATLEISVAVGVKGGIGSTEEEAWEFVAALEAETWVEVALGEADTAAEDWLRAVLEGITEATPLKGSAFREWVLWLFGR